MAHMKLDDGVLVHFKDGEPVSITWIPELLMYEDSSFEEHRKEAKKKLRECGFVISIGEVCMIDEDDAYAMILKPSYLDEDYGCINNHPIKFLDRSRNKCRVCCPAIPSED